MSLERHGVALVRADNPSPLTLDGTNTWLVGRDPCWVVDPGPALDAHVAAVAGAVADRGGLGGVALTHDHGDHAEAVDALLAAAGPAPVARGTTAGPLEAIPVPGHSDDHVAYAHGSVCFTGDAVLGAGSVFVSGRLAEYLDALRALRARGFALLCPGHGPPIEDPAAVLDRYVAHRLERERRLLAALDAGLRSVEELLDAAWDDAPAVLRPAGALTLGAHLDKLEREGRLPEGVERP